MREPTDDDVSRGLAARHQAPARVNRGVSDAAPAPTWSPKNNSKSTALERYLPAPVSPDAIRAAVRAAIAGGATTIGAVMGKVLPQFKGQADGSVISTIVREELAARG